MKKPLFTFGCALTVLGLLALIGGIGMFGLTVQRAVAAQKVATVPLEMGQTQTTDIIEVDIERLSQISVELKVHSTSVQVEQPQFDDETPEYELRYEFPIRYTVRDNEGEEIYSESTRAAWNEGMRSTTTHGSITADGGMAQVEHAFEKFRVPPPGQIQVQATILPDDTYQADVEQVRLHVYDNVSKHAESVAGGLGMLCLTPALILVGLLLSFIGLFANPSSSDGQRPHQPRAQ